MSTTIKVEFPDVDLPDGVNEVGYVMRLLRQALQSHPEACATYAGQLVGLTGPETRQNTATTASLSMAIGAIAFPKVGEAS